MNSTMQAVVIHGREDYRLEQVPMPVPGPGEALVKVHAVGICASDLKCYHGASMYWGDGAVPPNVDLLAIPGHEFVGEIVAIDDLGRQRWGVDTGDRVIAEQIVPCWACRFCRRGQYWMCAPHRIFGFRRTVNGAMAEYMIYPADAIVHTVSPDIPAAHAAFAEPLSCALHAVERAQVGFGDVVVVAGCGPIGLGMVAGARAKSPAHVIALDHIPAKLELAAKCGADITINIGTDDAKTIVRDLTEGYGADIYLDASGHPSAVPQGLDLLRKLGRYVEYGVFAAPVSVDWTIISDVKELDVLGAHLGPYCWPTAISMIEAKTLPLDRICSHQLPLHEFRAGLDLVGRGADSIKVTLLPGQGADM
jgi:threonine dehydrogenase-like Zn-dependent dehydrogenase